MNTKILDYLTPDTLCRMYVELEGQAHIFKAEVEEIKEAAIDNMGEADFEQECWKLREVHA